MSKKFHLYLSILSIGVSSFFINISQASDLKELSVDNLLLDLPISQQFYYKPQIRKALESFEMAKVTLRLMPLEEGEPKINLCITENAQNLEVGQIMFHIDGRAACLRCIEIKEEFQRNGYAKAALINFFKLMDSLKVSKTTCVLRSKNPHTAKLYLSIGMRFELEELKKLTFLETFDQFLQNSSGSENESLDMFRVFNTPFESSIPDQNHTFLYFKNLKEPVINN